MLQLTNTLHYGYRLKRKLCRATQNQDNFISLLLLFHSFTQFIHLPALEFIVLSFLHLLRLVVQHDQVSIHRQVCYLPATLKPERLSNAFFASQMSSYTTNAVPFLSPCVPLLRNLICFYLRICLIAPNLPKISQSSSAVILYGRLRTYRIRFTSPGNLTIFLDIEFADSEFNKKMDKSPKQIFTTEFWRELNEQYFIAPDFFLHWPNTTPRRLPVQIYSSLTSRKLIELSLQPRERNTISIWNAYNIRLRLALIFMERFTSPNDVEETLNTIIDRVSLERLSEGLDMALSAVAGTAGLAECDQINALREEAKILDAMYRQIELRDPIAAEIARLQSELREVAHSNKTKLKRLEQFIPEVNRSVLFDYKVKHLHGSRMLLKRLRRTDKAELKVSRELICLLQDYQVAEGIGRAVFNQRINGVTVTFDRSLAQQPVEMSLEQFTNLQRLRESPFELLDHTGLRSEDTTETQMCHFCRTMQDVKAMRLCSYNHVMMKLHEYNEDLLTEQRFRLSEHQLTSFWEDLYSANYTIEKDQIMCKRYFCNKCLRYEFEGSDLQTPPPSWICPLCKGLCSCVRCMRNDVIYKLKRCYLEIGGNLQDVYNESYFEKLVEDKRKSIRAMNLEFNAKIELEAESTSPLRNPGKKIRQTKKKKQLERLTSRIHKLSQIESSSSQSSKKVRRNQRNPGPGRE